jgi:membrane protein DedA with SNARE-associated domain
MDFAGHSILFSSQLGSIWSYIIIFFLAFLDTVFVIGTIFPGGIMVIGVGFLAAFSVLNVWTAFIVVVLGGLAGDLLTYYLGTHGTNWFKNESKLLKFTYLKKGQEFFEKHGDKSILMGRFMGVIKAVVPFVAGLLRMNFRKFVYLNILSGIIWAALYLGLGFFLGVTTNRFYISPSLKILILLIPFVIFIAWIIYESRTKMWKAVRSFFD